MKRRDLVLRVSYFTGEYFWLFKSHVVSRFVASLLKVDERKFWLVIMGCSLSWERSERSAADLAPPLVLEAEFIPSAEVIITTNL